MIDSCALKNDCPLEQDNIFEGATSPRSQLLHSLSGNALGSEISETEGEGLPVLNLANASGTESGLRRQSGSQRTVRSASGQSAHATPPVSGRHIGKVEHASTQLNLLAMKLGESYMAADLSALIFHKREVERKRNAVERLRHFQTPSLAMIDPATEEHRASELYQV